MSRASYLLTISLLLFAILPSVPAAAQAPAADLILVNGRIFTSDPARRWAQAVAIRGARIVAVGADAEISALAGKQTRRVDLGGRVVTPGFNDAHNHFMPDPDGHALRFKSQRPDQPPDPGWEETVEAVAAAARDVPRGTWLFGHVGSAVFLNPAADRFALDRAAPDHPVLLRTFYGHGYVVNTKAMSLLGIGEEEPDPAGGRYERVEGARKVNGRLWEYAAWRPLRTLSEKVTDEAAVRGLREMADEAVRSGVTSMQLMSSIPIERFVRLLAKADLPVRVRAIPFSLTSASGRDMSEIRLLRRLRPGHPRVSVGGIKWVLDGTPFEHGAAMVKESLSLGEQLLIHCAGDRCAEVVLDAMEKAGPAAAWPKRRMRIEHGDGVRDDLIGRAQKLGVIVVQNPTHFAPPELFRSRWGGGMQRLRSLVGGGVHLALGSDGPMNPFLNIMLATIHPYDGAEALTPEQAVEAYTRGAAYAEFAEGEKGTIAVGKLADLTVVSRDIFKTGPGDAPLAQSLLTIVGGKVVYDSGELKSSVASESSTRPGLGPVGSR
jgi:predicted amidohydrolase YtcJ